MTGTKEPNEERLRRALALIGEEAGRPTPVPPPGRTPWWRSRWGIATALATAAAAAIGVLTFSLGTSGEGGRDTGAAGQGQTEAEGIACSRFIAEGDVVAVRDADIPDRIILTFKVTDPIKPAEGNEQVELNLLDPAVVDPREAFQPGEHVLLMVQQRRDRKPVAFRGDELEAQRSEIERTLPKAAETTCPPYWRENSTVRPPSVPGDA